MVVMVIVSIMAAIAIPSFSAWRNKQAVVSATHTLLAQMKQARVAAMSENRSVSIKFCDGSVRNAWVFDPTAPTATCDPCAVSSCSENMVVYDQFSANLTISPTTTRTFTSRGTANSGSITLTVGAVSKTVTLNVIGRGYLQ